MLPTSILFYPYLTAKPIDTVGFSIDENVFLMSGIIMPVRIIFTSATNFDINCIVAVLYNIHGLARATLFYADLKSRNKWRVGTLNPTSTR